MNKNILSAIILTLFISAGLTANKLHGAVSPGDDLKVIQEKTFSIEPGKRLKLTGSSGDILVTGWDKSEVYVKILGNEKAKEKVDFTFDAGKDLIEITAKRDGFFLGSSGISLRFEIKVPKRFHNQLTTAGGDIRFAGVEGNNVLSTSGGDINLRETKGDINAKTSGGDITFEKVEGKFNVSTSGGDIKGREFSGDVSASTSGGDIVLDGRNAAIEAETSGGDITLNYTGQNKGIELATSGGDIKISVPADFSASAYLNTSGGDVELEAKTSNVKKLSSSRFEGDINGGGSKLVAKTSGGTIKVNTK